MRGKDFGIPWDKDHRYVLLLFIHSLHGLKCQVLKSIGFWVTNLYLGDCREPLVDVGTAKE